MAPVFLWVYLLQAGFNKEAAHLHFEEDFYRSDTIGVARGLIGALLHHETEEGLVSGIIVETEAYLSRNDAACHASRGLTGRNAVMFGPPGRAYIYFIYGNYYCFNVVTGPIGCGEAVLVRAVEPFDGIDLMMQRRGMEKSVYELANGPGKLCIALQISKAHNGHCLNKKPLYLERNNSSAEVKIIATPRIGISVEREKKLRFIAGGSNYLSRRERFA